MEVNGCMMREITYEAGGRVSGEPATEAAYIAAAAPVSSQLMAILDQQVALKNALLNTPTSRRFQATVLGLATLQMLNQVRRS